MAWLKRTPVLKETARKINSTSNFQYEFSHLPPITRGILWLILRLLFGRIRIDEKNITRLKALSKEGIIIYANKYKSHFEYILIQTLLFMKKAPYPVFGFDYVFVFLQPLRSLARKTIEYFRYITKRRKRPDPYTDNTYRKALLSGDSALLSLIEEKGLYRRLVESRKDPVDFLVEMQKTVDTPIYFVPQLVVYSKTPQTIRPKLIDLVFGTKERPGKLRRLLAVIRRPKSIWIEMPEPVSIKSFIESSGIRELSHKQQVTALRRHLLDIINMHRQSITGPDIKTREEIMEEVLTNPEIQKTIAQYATEEKKSFSAAQKEAAAYLDEIASNLNIKTIRLFDITLRWIIKSMFEGMVIDQDGIESVRKAARNGPLILVPCHKSHLDYLIISYIFYNHNMPCPLIAAGKNLSFWPLGPIFRAGGAFFLRRTFKGEKLYPVIFKAYIQKVIEEGFNIEFFIEGGRSRTGKLLQPKLGFLTLVIDAYLKAPWSDLNFIPIYIGYDRVVEEGAYVHELSGGKKTPENFINVLKAGKFLKKKYGKIYVNFNKPISLKEHIETFNEYENADEIEKRKINRRFAEKILAAINRMTVVTPHAVMASGILNSSKKRFYYKQLMDCVYMYLRYLEYRQVPLADTLIMDADSAFTRVLSDFIQNKYIEKGSSELPVTAESNPIFTVNENQRQNLEYYKNNGIIFFVPAAYTALAILAQDAFQFTSGSLHDDYRVLSQLFENEFIFDPDETMEFNVRKCIKAFIEEAIIIPHPSLPDTYNLTSSGFRKLQKFAAFLLPYFESYWIVLNYYARYTKQSILSDKENIKKIMALGARMYKRNDITRKEALSRINFSNAIRFFTRHGLENPEKDADRLKEYISLFEKFMKFLSD